MLLGSIIVISLLTAGCVGYAATAFADLAWLWIVPLSFVGAFVALLVLALVFLLAVIQPLKSDAVRETDSRFYRTVTNLYIDLIITLVGLRIETKGLEKRPTEGRFMLVSNHLHEIDPGILMRFFPKSQLAFIAKKEVKDMFLVGKILPQLLSQFIDRENDREALKTILRSIQILKDDRASIGVFPEGGINNQRKFKHFRPGVFKIAQKAKVPIVVCTLRNTHNVLRDVLHFKRPHVSMHVLEVVQPEWMEGKTTVEIADYIYGVMAEDLGPENCYVEENT